MCADVATALVSRDPETELLRWIEDDAVAHRRAPALPARDLLPPLERYARLVQAGEEHLVASVEASRGCVHRCRHCPVPVVYDGRIQINAVDAVVADVAQQVAMGARHVTYGDPDFFNGVHHALRVVRAVHERFPDLTFDCTVKVEHILRHADVWAEMAASGCIFVVSAFESVNDAELERLDKGHTAAEAGQAVELLRSHGIEIRPSWLPFTPWATLDDVRAILEFVAEHDLVGNVDPVQYTIRLLVPEGSLLLGHIDDLGPWDAARLTLPVGVTARPAPGPVRRARRGRGRRADHRGLRRAPGRGRARAARAHDGRRVTPAERALVLLRRADRAPAPRHLTPRDSFWRHLGPAEGRR